MRILAVARRGCLALIALFVLVVLHATVTPGATRNFGGCGEDGSLCLRTHPAVTAPARADATASAQPARGA